MSVWRYLIFKKKLLFKKYSKPFWYMKIYMFHFYLQLRSKNWDIFRNRDTYAKPLAFFDWSIWSHFAQNTLDFEVQRMWLMSRILTYHALISCRAQHKKGQRFRFFASFFDIFVSKQQVFSSKSVGSKLWLPVEKYTILKFDACKVKI